MRSWISLLALGSMAFCGACSDKTVLIRPADNIKVTCVKPPDDVVASGATLNLDATAQKIVEGAKLNAGTNITYQRIRTEIPNRRKGYCPQRTGWVAHLLANDLLAEAIKPETAAPRRAALLQLAQKRVKQSRDRYPPGFLPLKSTDELEAAIAAALKAR